MGIYNTATTTVETLLSIPGESKRAGKSEKGVKEDAAVEKVTASAVR